jgi:hypothetical protein
MVLKDDTGKWPAFVDSLRKDPLGATKELAQTAGKMALGYAEKRITDLSDKAQLLNPVTGTVKIGAGLVTKAVNEVKEIKAEYAAAGGGTKGAVRATVRAMAGPVAAHVGTAMAKAHKAGGGTGKVVDAGLSQLADETKDANPLYHLGVGTIGAPVATIDALERGDATAAGKHLAEGQSSLEEAAQALLPIAAEAGLFSEAAGAGRGAATGGGKRPGGLLADSKNLKSWEVRAEVEAGMERTGVPKELRGRSLGDTYLDDGTHDVGRNFPTTDDHPGGIAIDSGILREFPQPWKGWRSSPLKVRIEAVLQHEHWEVGGLSHNESVAAGRSGGPYTLTIGEEARKLLRSMPFRLDQPMPKGFP